MHNTKFSVLHECMNELIGDLPVGLSQALVDRLFYQIDQGQQPAQVHSVYMTAFQIQDERIQDLLQAQPSISSARQLQRKGEAARTVAFLGVI